MATGHEEMTGKRCGSDPNDRELYKKYKQLENGEELCRAFQESKAHYNTSMEQFINNVKEQELDQEVCKKQHELLKQAAIKIFCEKSKSFRHPDNVKDQFLEELKKFCDDTLGDLVTRTKLNQMLENAEIYVEQYYRKKMDRILEKEYLQDRELQEKHTSCKNYAIQQYKKYMEIFEQMPTNINRIEKVLDYIFYEYKDQNQRNREHYRKVCETQFQNLISDLKTKYQEYMSEIFNSRTSPYFEDQELIINHTEVTNRILDIYAGTTFVAKLEDQGKYNEILKKNIEEWYSLFQTENLRIRNKMIKELESAFFQIYYSAKLMYEDSMTNYIIKFAKLGMTDEDLDQKHLTEKETALSYYQKEKNLRNTNHPVVSSYKIKLNEELDKLLVDYKDLLKRRGDQKSNEILECHIWDILTEAQESYRKHMKNKIDSTKKLMDHGELQKEHELAAQKAKAFYKKKIEAISNVDSDDEFSKLEEMLEELFREFDEIIENRRIIANNEIEKLCLNAFIESQDAYAKLVQNFLTQKKGKKRSDFLKEIKNINKEVLNNYNRMTREVKTHKSAKNYQEQLQEYIQSIQVLKLQKEQ